MADLPTLKSTMTARSFPLSFDHLDPRSSYLLNVTLADYLPKGSQPEPYSSPQLPTFDEAWSLPPTHHLVYFPPSMPDSLLLPDGTDPEQSPGEPFVRRMWAGGELHFSNSTENRLCLDGGRVACVERIKDVAIKGHEGRELIFVSMERIIGRCNNSEDEQQIRERFSKERQPLIEERNIVFMKSSPEGGKKGNKKPLKPEHKADFEHTVMPNPKLLFRYSALTFNTHAIHRDPAYCHNVEHHPDLIVHGPLSLTFLDFKYRNTHPLYNGHPAKYCGRKASEGEWELSAETPEGELAVMGTAHTEEVQGGKKPHDLFQDMKEMGIP